MMNLTLPKSFEIDGKGYAIRWDFRAALEIIAALSDPELNDQERAIAALVIFYPDFDNMPPSSYAAAANLCLWFLNGGTEERGRAPKPKLMDWEQDFPLIVGPISKIFGADIRGMESLHWWSFLTAYMEIGDCLFAHVVSIRAKRAKGVKLSKEDRVFYRENQDLIELKTRYTNEEQAALAQWAGRG